MLSITEHIQAPNSRSGMAGGFLGTHLGAYVFAMRDMQQPGNLADQVVSWASRWASEYATSHMVSTMWIFCACVKCSFMAEVKRW